MHKMCALRLSERDRREIAWLKEETPAYFGLESVVRVKTLLKDLKHLTKINHTGHLENFVNMVVLSLICQMLTTLSLRNNITLFGQQVVLSQT